MSVTAPVSLTKIVAEFGGPGNLAAYVRGGAYVPNTPTNAAISTTVAGLALSQFLGAAKDTPMTLHSNDPTVSVLDKGVFTFPGAAIITATGGNRPITSASAVAKSGSTLLTLVMPATITADGATASVQANSPTTAGLDTSSVWTWTLSDGTHTVSIDMTIIASSV